MRTARSLLAAGVLATSAVLGTVGIYHLVHVHAMTSVAVSGDVTRLPGRSDFEYAPLSEASVKVSADQALRTAEAGFGLTDSQIDQRIGIVRAVVNFRRSMIAKYHNEKAWVVTADYDTVAPGNGVLYHKVCIVIDATTGQYEYAYTVDPDQHRS